jgi:rhamnogalacturonan acetylesterase
MLYSQVVSVLALAATALAAPSSDISKRAQTVYLAGDSTMAKANGAITGAFIPIFRHLSPLEQVIPNTKQAGVSTSPTPSP